MRFRQETYSQTLKDLATEASGTPEWSEYASFCTQSELGLRKQALASLERFICKFEQASFSARRHFVSWLLTNAESKGLGEVPIPHPLKTRLIQPTLLEWLLVEPNFSEPHRWLGDREHLTEAIRLDPNDELARRKLVVWIINKVGFNGHELPRGYLGDVDRDLKDLSEAEELIEAITDKERRDNFEAQIKRNRDAINKHLQKSKNNAQNHVE